MNLISNGGETTSYTYDANGNQVLKKIGDAVVTPPTPTPKPTPKPTLTPTPRPTQGPWLSPTVIAPITPWPTHTNPGGSPSWDVMRAPLADIDDNTAIPVVDEFEPTVVTIQVQAAAVSNGETAYAYDVFNRLVSVNETTSGTTNYTYRPNGMRQAKIGTVITTHVWDGGNIVLDISGSTVNTYLRGVNLIKDKSGYFLFNAHGDVVQHGSKGYKYDAFGNELAENANDTNPFRYAGEYFDKETETYYLRARYYEPKTGRFLTEDPIRDGLNWYTYCLGNPVLFVDPSGLDPDMFGMYIYDGSVSQTHNTGPVQAQLSWAEEIQAQIDYVEWLLDLSKENLGHGVLISLNNAVEHMDEIWGSAFTMQLAGAASRGWLSEPSSTTYLITGDEWYEYFSSQYGAANVKWMPQSFAHIIDHPQTLWGSTKEEIAKILGDNWVMKPYGSAKTGWEFVNKAHSDWTVFFHPGGGIHGGSYYGYTGPNSNGITSRIKLVGTDYVRYPDDKAIIIPME